MEKSMPGRNLALGGIMLLSVIFSESNSSLAVATTDSACPQFADGVAVGNIQSALLNETSGLAASRKNSNVLWAHNDSGDSARVFAMDVQGRHLGIYNLVGVTALDWEDMAIGPGPVTGQDYLYLGDIGDNYRLRPSIVVYRVPEPTVSATQTPVSVDLSDWDRLPMRYPGGVAYDSETLLVDPISGDLFGVTRDRAGEGVARVFRNPAPHTAGVTVTLELVATLSLATEIKAGDVSPSGDAVLLRPHSFSAPSSGYYWTRAPATNLWDAFAAQPCLTPLTNEAQGEALAFAADGNGYRTTSEGTNPPLYFYARQITRLYLPLISR
ncbi:MAG: hypothetical protein FJ009_06710 [Chloroflexi bacterium]|nr:hypothetical protein [Chloroflexota bacterium]